MIIQPSAFLILVLVRRVEVQMRVLILRCLSLDVNFGVVLVSCLLYMNEKVKSGIRVLTQLVGILSSSLFKG